MTQYNTTLVDMDFFALTGGHSFALAVFVIALMFLALAVFTVVATIVMNLSSALSRSSPAFSTLICFCLATLGMISMVFIALLSRTTALMLPRPASITLSVFLHYFVLAAFSWLLCQVLHLYTQCMDSPRPPVVWQVIGWLLPAGIVGISIVVAGICSYGSDSGALNITVTPVLGGLLAPIVLFVVLTLVYTVRSLSSAVASPAAEEIRALRMRHLLVTGTLTFASLCGLFIALDLDAAADGVLLIILSMTLAGLGVIIYYYHAMAGCFSRMHHNRKLSLPYLLYSDITPMSGIAYCDPVAEFSKSPRASTNPLYCVSSLPPVLGEAYVMSFGEVPMETDEVALEEGRTVDV